VIELPVPASWGFKIKVHDHDIGHQIKVFYVATATNTTALLTVLLTALDHSSP